MCQGLPADHVAVNTADGGSAPTNSSSASAGSGAIAFIGGPTSWWVLQRHW
jgi:hypothetical protein